ncbi:ABC-type transport system periplasmic substrate-binding protein [Haloterrigena salina JCM 13891]|uniref:ABC-type transport system periplasmic substrate-binding protein n=2 Tax=Haloterrigena salina TaxID=504937 RepID=M0CRX7_9EURY|nr:ABC-type transport system periplasmic substrate-binding protein [Haloterrigena salina JCM 13891]
MYSQLSRINYNMEREDDLATEWEAQDDELTEWSVEIRDDAVFHHNEKTVTAEDVATTYNTIIEGEHPGAGTLGGIENAEVIDEYTVGFNLTRSNPDFPKYQSLAWASIVPKDIIENDFESLQTEEYGSGPYILDSFSNQDEIIMRQNPDFYLTDEEGNTLPYADELTLSHVPDSGTEVTRLQNRESDIIHRTDPSQFDRLESIDHVEPQRATAGNFIAFVMNNEHEPWNDNRVRRAMKLAVNREEFVQSVLQGYGRIGQDSVLAPMFPYHTDLPNRSQDLERARELLAEAGYEDGFHLTEDFDITFYTPSEPAEQRNSAVLFQEQFSQIGVEMDLEQVSYDYFNTEIWGESPTYAVHYGTYLNEDHLLSNLIWSDGDWWSENSWENEEKDQLIEEARRTTDEEERGEMYERVQELMYEEGPYVIPFHMENLGANAEQVDGWERHSMLEHDHLDRVEMQ